MDATLEIGTEVYPELSVAMIQPGIDTLLR
jgi:hypothetical protein